MKLLDESKRDDLVYFTTRALDTSDTSGTQVRHECDMNEPQATGVRHEWATSDTSATRAWHEWKILILITTRMKTYFHIPILAT